MAERPVTLRLEAQYAMVDAMLGDIVDMITQLGPSVSDDGAFSSDDGALLASINAILERISDLMNALLANEPRDDELL